MLEAFEREFEGNLKNQTHEFI